MTLTAVDAAGHPTPLAARHAGYAAVIQYMTGSYAMPPTYPAACTNTGIPLISAWEESGTAALGGVAQGRADATAAVAAARGFGQPQGSAIYAAVDFGPSQQQMPTVVAYAAAFADGVRAAGYVAGIYGSDETCVACTPMVDRLWQTLAWSSGAKDPHAAMYQGGTQVTVAGVTCDEDTILATPGAWTLDGPVALFDPPEDADMKWMIATYDNALYALIPGPTGLHKAHILTPGMVTALKKAGAVDIGSTLPQTEIAKLPNATAVVPAAV